MFQSTSPWDNKAIYVHIQQGEYSSLDLELMQMYSFTEKIASWIYISNDTMVYDIIGVYKRQNTTSVIMAFEIVSLLSHVFTGRSHEDPVSNSNGNRPWDCDIDNHL